MRERRLVESADAERRAIERALHDGVQQDLIALSVRLQLLRRLADDDIAAALGVLDDMRSDVHDALERVRALADGVYPSLLEPLGLAEALRAAGIEVEADGLVRGEPAVEATAYFVCRDLCGSRAAVRLRRAAEVLSLELELDDQDGDRIAAARDRVEAMGGTMTVELRDGVVYVSAEIPERPSAR
ncbi:MAG: sensor histidine kinase [Gaiellaceae bacterium]